jgi:hypothetical protein
MDGPFASRLFRITFALAAVYNLAFGLWAAIWPLAFFEWFAIEPPRYPRIWACLGMVVGVYGLLYAHAACKLETARPIIAVGLLGKVLGPIGMITNFSDDWPLRLGMLCVWNDLIWWMPFGLFLLRGMAISRRIAAFAPASCALLHVAGLAAMAFLLRGGMVSEPDAAIRAQFIATHPIGWAIGWGTWMLAAQSVVGFYVWWAAKLSRPDRTRTKTGVTIAVLLAAAGMVCDLTGESISVLILGEAAITSQPFPSSAERLATLLTAGAANVLYTFGGVVLMFSTRELPTSIRAAMWVTWFAGLTMSISAVAGFTPGLVAGTVLLFPLLTIWVTWMGLRWRPA